MLWPHRSMQLAPVMEAEGASTPSSTRIHRALHQHAYPGHAFWHWAAAPPGFWDALKADKV